MSKSTQPAVPMGNDEYETGQDVQALQRAREVKRDPKRHSKAKAHAKKMLAEHRKKGAALAAVARPGAKTQKAAAKFDAGSYD